MTDRDDDRARGARRRERGPAQEEPRVLAPPSSDEAASAEQRDQIEWECDQLVALVARVNARRADHPDDRLLDWMAREARARSEALGERLDVERVEAVRDRIRRRASRERIAVLRVEHAPEWRHVEGEMRAAELLDGCSVAATAPLVDLAVAAGAGRELWDAACDTVVALPDEIPRGRHLALRVSGDSMTPLLHTGDVILVRLDAGLQRDAIVVARVPDDGGYVVKRVGAVSRRTVELRSLNSAYPPIAIPNDPALIVGTVILRWCEHGEDEAAT